MAAAPLLSEPPRSAETMRVGIDLFSLVPGIGRGGRFHRYTTGLIDALAQLDNDHQFVLFLNETQP